MLAKFWIPAAQILVVVVLFNDVGHSSASERNLGLTPSAQSLRSLGGSNQVINHIKRDQNGLGAIDGVNFTES